ncbi:leucyl/phenylalanyl-tRNA--protein transferase [Roseovarius sp. M141]|uniref:leucyl/phenylalanyl-tRNA--protein transferase n=1 Tax=Roseovarius sp. M141 TaxID=2583806 RepID=UPI0020CC6C48|nr:leucyl/phenylalanyl-tRNA--protein transferase [Roseovarius sp. M141]MCQ0093868.1 leucyl/phenylalanyl-tRNA--protein transferase [Roseovarius sp. M141]
MTDDDFVLTPELLLNAYAAGVFPMSEGRDDPEIFWVDPRRRGVLPLNGLHISRSLARRMRRGVYQVSLNTDFAGVIDACADRPETWINAEIRRLYLLLNEMGHAHSLEIRQDGALVGGVYGVTLGAAFFGESMFSRHTDGSKLALVHMVDHLRRCGYMLFDTQFITDHLASLGAAEISRAAYRRQLATALHYPAHMARHPLDRDTQSVLQRSTQTS